jgi:hypothetical protein
MKSFEISEEDLQNCIDLVGPQGEGLRMPYHILTQMLQMGQQHRYSWRVILHNGDHEPEVSETYADYLDRKACGEEVWFDPAGEGTVFFSEEAYNEAIASHNAEDDEDEPTSEEN